MRIDRATVIELVRLAWPLALVHIGTSTIGVIDTAVVGRTSAAELAGLGLGNSLLFSFSVFGMGLVLGTEPLIAQALGAGDVRRARRGFRQGVWMALWATPLVWFATALTMVGLPQLGVGEDVALYTRDHVVARAPGVLPFLLYWSVKAWLQAHGFTTAPVVGVVLGIVLELLLDLLLVFGSPMLDIPALGVVGAGLANTVTNTVRLIVVVLAAEKLLRDRNISGETRPFSWQERWQRMQDARVASEIKTVLRVGLPLGLTLALEVAVFAFAALAVGQMGATALAAHQVALQAVSTTFHAMVGLGSATSVVVGRRIGASDPRGAFHAGILALLLAAGAMVLTGILFFTAGLSIARLLTDSSVVAASASTLLAIAAAFQLSDGLQTIAAGALRGAGDTRASFIIQLIAHWAVGMPCVLVFAGIMKMGAPGVWWGLTVGLSAAAALLVTRFITRGRRGYRPFVTLQ